MAATGALFVAAVGTAANIDANKRAARRQQRAQDIQQSQQIAEQRVSQRQQMREERIRRARIINAASQTGVARSSGEVGALGSLSTRLASNIAFGQGQTRSAISIGNQLSEAASAREQGNIAGAIAGFASTIFSSGALGESTIFSGG